MKLNRTHKFRIICLLAILLTNFLVIPQNSEIGFETQSGKASFYAKKFNGRRTASGEIYNGRLYTCAHKTLPFGTYLRVTHHDNCNSVIVRVNDRGPFVRGRIIDLTYAAAKDLGIIANGTGMVNIEILGATKSDTIENFTIDQDLTSKYSYKD